MPIQRTIAPYWKEAI
jgi:hypothetical protein